MRQEFEPFRRETHGARPGLEPAAGSKPSLPERIQKEVDEQNIDFAKRDLGIE
jgi:hypothetical protein